MNIIIHVCHHLICADRTGVQSVDADFEKSEIKVKGMIDVIKIHKLIEKLSKKKVELISPQIKLKEKESAGTDQKKPKETKEVKLQLKLFIQLASSWISHKISSDYGHH